MKAYFARMYQMDAFVKAELYFVVEATASDTPTRSPLENLQHDMTPKKL